MFILFKKISRISNNISDDFLKRIVRGAMCSYEERKWNEQGLMYGRWGYWFCFSFKWLHTSSCLKTFQAWLYAERVRQQTKSGTDCDNIPIGYILVWNRLIIFRSDTSLSGTDCDNIPIRYILVLPFYRITYLIILIFKKMETLRK